MQHPQKKGAKPGKRRAALYAAISLALAAGIYLGVTAYIARNPGRVLPPAENALEFKTLEKNEAAGLSGITVTHEGGESFGLVYRDEALYLTGDNGGLTRINPVFQEDILKAATELNIESTVDESAQSLAEHLPDMGLSPALIRAEVAYADGRAYTISLGHNLPGTTYYYYRVSSMDGVYLCDSGTYDAFAHTEATLLKAAQPELVRSLIDRVSIERAGEAPVTMAFAGGAGVLQTPETYPMSSAGADSILTALDSLYLGSPLGELTEETKAEYGLDGGATLITVRQAAGAYTGVNESGQMEVLQAEERVVSFSIGRMEREYFYCVGYEGHGYLVSAFLISPLANADYASLATRAPADMGGKEISTITLQKGGEVIDIRITRTERVLPNNQLETDEDGNTVFDVSATLGGEELPVDAADAFIERLRAMTVSGSLDAGYKPSGDAPRWQLTLTCAGGATRTIAAYPLDAFHDAVTVDGVALHYMISEAMDTALGGLKAK